MNSKGIFLALTLLLTFSNAISQCAMCKAVAEDGAGQSGSISNGMNTGILFLMAIPYLIFATIGIVFWVRYKKKKSESVKRD